jgi:hypothetical protein
MDFGSEQDDMNEDNLDEIKTMILSQNTALLLKKNPTQEKYFPKSDN